MASNYGYSKHRPWTISPASRKYIIHTDSLQPVHPPSPVRMVQGLYCKVRSVYSGSTGRGNLEASAFLRGCVPLPLLVPMFCLLQMVKISHSWQYFEFCPFRKVLTFAPLMCLKNSGAQCLWVFIHRGVFFCMCRGWSRWWGGESPFLGDKNIKPKKFLDPSQDPHPMYAKMFPWQVSWAPSGL